MLMAIKLLTNRESDMNLLNTDRTYATRENAIKALELGCKKIGSTIDKIRFVIAVNEAGRFAPVVVGDRAENNQLLFCGITWVS